MDPTSPISAAICASSPERCPTASASDDSFNQAFTSIKTTDDSLSSRSHILEQLTYTDSSICSLPEGNSIETQRLDSCNESTAILDPSAPFLSVVTNYNDADTKSNPNQPRASISSTSSLGREGVSNTSKTEKPVRKTRFQNTVHSMSDNFDNHLFQCSNQPPGTDEVIEISWL